MVHFTTGKMPTLFATRRLLYVLGIGGILGTWGRSTLDGTISHLLDAMHGGRPYMLPGTNDVLRESFTGIPFPIDYLLKILVVFFWEAVDGSRPGTSAIGIYFLGQLFPIIILIYLDALREGNVTAMKRRGFANATFWLLGFQCGAIGCVGPVWALSYIKTSPLASDTAVPAARLVRQSLIDLRAAKTLVPAVAIGYWLPAIMMGFPSTTGVISNSFQQYSIAAWNAYPLLIWGAFYTLAIPSRRSFRLSKGVDSRNHLRAVQSIYASAFIVSTILHISSVTLSITTILFPAMFKTSIIAELHPYYLTIPPFSVHQGATVGAGVRSFMLWDQVFGYSTILVVMLRQLRTAATAVGVQPSWTKLAPFVLVTLTLAGPGSACLALGWERDALLFKAESNVERQRSKLG